LGDSTHTAAADTDKIIMFILLAHSVFPGHTRSDNSAILTS
jgi:hypothetical protein